MSPRDYWHERVERLRVRDERRLPFPPASSARKAGRASSGEEAEERRDDLAEQREQAQK